MYQKSHLLFTTLLASLMLVACDSDTNETALSNQPVEQSTEVVQLGSSEELIVEKAMVAEAEETTEDPVENMDTSTQNQDVEQQAETEVENNKENKSVNMEEQSDQTTEVLNPVMELALEKIIAEANLDKRLYRFSFEVAEEYVQVEAREKDKNIAALQGIYRYIIATDDVLYSDYLTGDFVPFN